MISHDLTSLLLFAEVVEQRNIAGAAREKNLATSAASKRISDLELRMGTALLNRLHNGIIPTPAGEALYNHVKRIESILQDVETEIGEYARGARGHVRIWANWSALAQFLPEDLAMYAQRFPDVGLDLKVDVSGAIVEAVSMGEADIGIYSNHIGPTSLCERVYRRDTLVVVAPRGHAFEGRASVSLRELSEHPIVSLSVKSTLSTRLAAEAAVIGVPLRVKIEVLDFDSVRGLVAAGLGVSVLPQGAVEPYLGGDLSIISVPFNEPWATRSLMIGYRAEEALTAAARDLIMCLAPGLDTKA